MKKIIGAAALATTTIFAGAALANDTLDASFGNSVVVAAEDGTVLATYYMHEGNTYEMATAEGTIGGSWHLTDEGQICLTPTGGEEACSDLVDGMGVGDTWEGEGADGSAITLTIVEGR